MRGRDTKRVGGERAKTAIFAELQPCGWQESNLRPPHLATRRSPIEAIVFFTTARWMHEPGNVRDCNCREALADACGNVALPTELQALLPGGTRTRDTRRGKRSNRSLHHRSGSGLSGNRRDGNDILKRKANPCGEGPQPASRRPLRQAPPRYGQDAGLYRDHFRGGAVSWREVSDLFTTDRWFQGNERHGSGRLKDEEVRVFTTWIQNSPLFPASVAPKGLETKNPSGAWLGRGSIRSNCGRALRHSSLARAHARATQCKALGVPIQIVDHAWHVGALGCHGATIAP
jgi:hypothetical protein